jgi:hypothetical protein
MQTVINQNAALLATSACHNFTPLEQEARSHVETACAAFHLMRKPQTMRAYACLENGPIRPIRINGRLAWPVAAIRALLNGEVA